MERVVFAGDSRAMYAFDLGPKDMADSFEDQLTATGSPRFPVLEFAVLPSGCPTYPVGAAEEPSARGAIA